MSIDLKLNNFWRVLLPFALTQVLGIFVAHRLLPQLAYVKPVNWGGFSLADFLILAALIVAFFLFTAKFKRIGSQFFKFFLSFIIFSGTQVIFGAVFDPSVSTALAIAMIIFFWFFQNILIQNLVMVLTIAGIAAAIGISLAPIIVVYILIIFSFYDIISVYKTGHMIKLAQAMIESRAIFGFVIPEPGRTIHERVSNIAPGQGFMILGSGDVIFPLLLSVSLIRVSLAQAMLVTVFSGLGLFLMHLIFSNQRVRRPMAALPPIALMSIVGYLAANLL